MSSLFNSEAFEQIPGQLSIDQVRDTQLPNHVRAIAERLSSQGFKIDARRLLLAANMLEAQS